MPRIEIDLSRLTERDGAHESLRAALGNGYAGRNLDALYDHLTSLPEADAHLTGALRAAGYARSVLRVFRDAARENPGLRLAEEYPAGGIKIGAGLYIVRDDAARDLDGTFQKIRAIGYEGAELLGLFGAAPEALCALSGVLGLELLGDHAPVSDFLGEAKAAVLRHAAAGCGRVTLSCPKERVESEPFEKLAEEFAAAAKNCLDARLTPMYHNHDFDMRGDAPFAARMLDAVPDLRFEPDVGWMLVAGKDPAEYLEKYRNRTPVVHLKDVFVYEGGFSFRPVGYGAVNVPRLLPFILACAPEWLVIDHDFAYARDPYGDLALSFEYVRKLLTLSP